MLHRKQHSNKMAASRIYPTQPAEKKLVPNQKIQIKKPSAGKRWPSIILPKQKTSFTALAVPPQTGPHISCDTLNSSWYE